MNRDVELLSIGNITTQEQESADETDTWYDSIESEDIYWIDYTDASSRLVKITCNF